MLQYLKTIKNILVTKDHSDLELNILKLKNYEKEPEIVSIINAINRYQHDKAINQINDFLKSKEKLIKKGDVNVSGLRTESMLLETQLSVLHSRKAEMQKLINDFRIRHNSELGMIIGDILNLRIKLLAFEKDNNPDKEDEYEDAKQDQKKFEETKKATDTKRFVKIDIASKKKLQKKFREASKLCHPDLISDELKAQATQIFTDLHKAYLANDLQKIEEILKMLRESDLSFVSKSSSLNEVQKLKTHITTLKSQLINLNNEIDVIENSSAFQTIQQIEDWDDYFEQLILKFSNELEKLKEEYAGKHPNIT